VVDPVYHFHGHNPAANSPLLGTAAMNEASESRSFAALPSDRSIT
jgi:hypothetical protein